MEVLSGLEAGQQVVRAGHQKLFPGAKVMPIASRVSGAAPGESPPASPEAPADASTGRWAGFWKRNGAYLILIAVLSLPLFYVLLSVWRRRSARAVVP